MQSKLGLTDIRSALSDIRFRELFPEHTEEINTFLKNPSCACNATLYRKILQHKDRLQQYFPTKEIETPAEELDKLAQNHWSVINCTIDELEGKLRKLPKGRKQLAIARYENTVTVVVNELEIVY